MSNEVHAWTNTFLAWAALQGGGGGWFSWAVLAVTSLLLLISGIILLILGTRDLIKDLRNSRRQF
jgi:hypothetical protein